MKKYLQLKGQTFGMLTITHIFNSQKCKAKCECGTEKEYKLGNIKYGRTKSCGCNRYVTGKPKPRKADKRKFSKPVLPEGTGSRKVKILTGIRFGKWTVINDPS